MAMRKFLDEAESRHQIAPHQSTPRSQETKKDTSEGDAEGKEEDPVKDEQWEEIL